MGAGSDELNGASIQKSSQLARGAGAIRLTFRWA